MILDPQLAALLKWPVAVTLLWLGLMSMPQAAYPQVRPDARLTPGAVNAEVIADRSGDKHLIDGVEYNICARDFRTRPFRKTSRVLKKAVCAEYHAEDCPNVKRGEVDHLIPLELGGADVLANLWWEPAPGYHVKDHQVEDKLPKLVCAGKISLSDAQECVRSDWVKCAVRIKGLQ